MKKQLRNWRWCNYAILVGSASLLAVSIWKQVETGYISSLVGYSLLAFTGAGFVDMGITAFSKMDDRLTKLENNNGRNPSQLEKSESN